MNGAIERARELRASGEEFAPSALYKVSKDDAESILNWIRDNANGLLAMAHPVKALYGHLTRDELAASIYRHAMIEAGGVVEARTMKPYDICPYCAYRFA